VGASETIANDIGWAKKARNPAPTKKLKLREDAATFGEEPLGSHP
jgi:hypothetical protein